VPALPAHQVEEGVQQRRLALQQVHPCGRRVHHARVHSQQGVSGRRLLPARGDTGQARAGVLQLPASIATSAAPRSRRDCEREAGEAHLSSRRCSASASITSCSLLVA
jgi:hypothetical protein